MLDINLIRTNPDAARNALRKRNMNVGFVDDFLALDTRWRAITKALDEARRGLNEFSKARNIEEAKKVKETVKQLEQEINAIEPERATMIDRLPNIPAETVPVGKSEEENVVLREVGERTSARKDYLTIAEEFDLIDTKRSAKVSGSRFGYLKGPFALLEFALTKFAMDTLVPEGFIPVIPPVMIKPEPYRRMGRLAGDQKEERYHLEKDDLYLVGSAEHTIGPMHMDEVFEEKELPRRYVGFSTCFRREAGSYGKDTKGIFRVHQFDKVEMFAFTKPEDSEREHQFLLSLQEKMMRKLGLPYRVVEVCTGDMGFTDAKQYDIEVWLPSENRYRETHSCSNTTDFQARGINARYRANGKSPSLDESRRGGQSANRTEYVHMLNATVFSQRPLIAILENCQTKKGTIKIPKVLQKYVGIKEIKKTDAK